MRRRCSWPVTLIGAALALCPRPARADVPQARVSYPVLEPGDPSARADEGRAATLDEYRQAHRERIAGGVLIASCAIPLSLGALGLTTLSRRNVEGGTGTGLFDLIYVGAFAAGASCELFGVPIAIVGLAGPMRPPRAPSWTPSPSEARPLRGIALSWSF